MKIAVVILIAAFLGGCSTGGQAMIDAALERSEAGIKAAKDREAIALKQAPCLIDIGAKNRVLTQIEIDAVESLCGGSPGLTFQDLQSLSRAMSALESAMPRSPQDPLNILPPN